MGHCYAKHQAAIQIRLTDFELCFSNLTIYLHAPRLFSLYRDYLVQAEKLQDDCRPA
jgi:hypothetical protein